MLESQLSVREYFKFCYQAWVNSMHQNKSFDEIERRWNEYVLAREAYLHGPYIKAEEIALA